MASVEAHQIITVAERMSLAVVSEAPGGMTGSVLTMFSSGGVALVAIVEGAAVVSSGARTSISSILLCCRQMGMAGLAAAGGFAGALNSDAAGGNGSSSRLQAGSTDGSQGTGNHHWGSILT